MCKAGFKTRIYIKKKLNYVAVKFENKTAVSLYDNCDIMTSWTTHWSCFIFINSFELGCWESVDESCYFGVTGWCHIGLIPRLS